MEETLDAVLDRVAVWTIGHSNQSVERFLELLEEHFKREEMERWLLTSNVRYLKSYKQVRRHL